MKDFLSYKSILNNAKGYDLSDTEIRELYEKFDRLYSYQELLEIIRE